jgi:hypothetical protein
MEQVEGFEDKTSETITDDGLGAIVVLMMQNTRTIGNFI